MAAAMSMKHMERTTFIHRGIMRSRRPRSVLLDALPDFHRVRCSLRSIGATPVEMHHDMTRKSVPSNGPDNVTAGAKWLRQMFFT